MKLVLALIASVLLVAVSAELLTMSTFSDAQCTNLLSYSTSNIFSCTGLPVGVCQPAAQGTYAMATCSTQWPKPTVSGSVTAIFNSPNCTASPINLSFWADKKCVPEGAGSEMRSCEMMNGNSPVLRAIYCEDDVCSRNCTSQVWKLTPTSSSTSGVCNNAGAPSSVLFQCYNF